MTYIEDNNKLFNFYLENTFFKSWKTHSDDAPTYLSNYKNLELIVDNKCNLQCTYCYMNKYGDKYFPKGTQNKDSILHNTDLIIEWLHENKMCPIIEPFAGDTLTSPLNRKILHKFLDNALVGKRVTNMLMLPTNMWWVTNEKRLNDVKSLLEKAEYANVTLSISASVDGKYMDYANRPARSKSHVYDDTYYTKMFEVLSELPSKGVHPMVYSNNIEKWIDNFLWWQEKLQQYGMPWWNIYLLEVRNQEWTQQQILDYQKFIRFLIRWSFEKCEYDVDTFLRFLFKLRGFNILSSALSSSGRGLTCSIQSSLVVRLGDLSIVPCHRTAYNFMEAGKFLVEDNKISGIESKNLELWFAIQSLHNTTYPYCETCLINSVCNGGCLGSQYESTGDIFTPIPTVCNLFHSKMFAIVDEFNKLDILSSLVTWLDRDKVLALENILCLVKETDNGV